MEQLRSPDEEVFVTDLVLAEVAAVLRTSRFGRMSHLEIQEFLLPILAAPGVRVSEKAIWPRVLELFVQHRVDLPDAHQIALVERDGEGEIISFDTDFDRIPGVKRIEP